MIVGSVMDFVVVFVLAKTLTIDVHVWKELLLLKMALIMEV